MNESQTAFIKFFKKWFEENWYGSRPELAKFLGISYSQLANLLNEYRGGKEETRKKICSKIGVDYRTLIDTENILSQPDQAGVYDIALRRRQSDHIDPELKSMIDNLTTIYNSGNEEAINGVRAFLEAIVAGKSRKKIKASG
jgi:transcriptional regulator with XRE-family HTH domain